MRAVLFAISGVNERAAANAPDEKHSHRILRDGTGTGTGNTDTNRRKETGRSDAETNAVRAQTIPHGVAA
jgi:hypothetical protein